MKTKLAIIALLSIACGILALPSTQTDISVLHTARSAYGSIWVYETQGKRCLSFNAPHLYKAEQTCMFLAKPLIPAFTYHKMILAGLYLQPAPQKVLMIGLGGGMLARQLKYLVPNVQIEIVEINPVVLALAKEFFALQENSGLKVFIADAVNYVANAISRRQQYDFIILDAFDEHYIPPQLLTQEFISQLKALLTHKGVLAINSFASSPTSYMETQLILDSFGQLYNLVDSNRVILAMNSQLPAIEKLKITAANWHAPFTNLEIDEQWLLRQFKLLSK